MNAVDDVRGRFLSERDANILELAGFGGKVGIGERPALLLVDVNDSFCGPEELPIEESVLRWRSSCGTAAWDAVRAMVPLVQSARERGIPVIYTTGRVEPGGRGRWHDKVDPEIAKRRPSHPFRINQLVAPLEDEIVLEKPKPSAFFATTLLARLIERGVDSVVICGGTTSGCVRATAVDAFSYDLKAAVVSDGTFDRLELSHAASLLDLSAKYADVMTSAEVVNVFDTISGGDR